MKFKSVIAAFFAAALSCAPAFGQATLLPPGEQCFQATTGINGMVGTLGTITGGTLYTNGTYGGVALTGGSGSGATANITVSGGAVTGVAILNPGIQYVVGDALSATAASIGGTGSGFSVSILSVSINSSLAGGTVGYYIPTTLTPKQTWKDSGEIVLNTNPVALDSNGCAVVYGAGIYRQILKDSLGNTVWDKLTAATGASSIFWAGLAGGTGNAITLVDTAFANQDGATIQFLAKLANTGPTTVTISGGSPIAIVRDTSTGPAALSGGEIGISNTPMITYDATNSEFHIINPAISTSSSASSAIIPPQGYLNLVGQATGDVIQTADVIAATTVYYSPFVGSVIPIWNGSSFVLTQFSELTATLTSAGSPISTIQDECVFSNNGVPTLVTGPSWTTVTAGAGSRGTGAGSAQIIRVQGVWVNAVSIIGYNGVSSYTIPANQCTYVGSISVDTTAGQVTAHVSWGQNRKFGIWNAYNRTPISLSAGDAAASWPYSTNTVRQSNGGTGNNLQIFAGLIEEPFALSFIQKITVSSGASAEAGQIGIGYNSTTVQTGTVAAIQATAVAGSANAIQATVAASYDAPPALGINVINATEISPVTGSATTYFGTQPFMKLSAKWRG